MRTMLDHETSWLRTAIESHISSAVPEEIKKRLLDAGVMLFASPAGAIETYDLFSSEDNGEITLTSSFDFEPIPHDEAVAWSVEPTVYLLEQGALLCDRDFELGMAA